jgi:hypothetical protein
MVVTVTVVAAAKFAVTVTGPIMVTLRGVVVPDTVPPVKPVN